MDLPVGLFGCRSLRTAARGASASQWRQNRRSRAQREALDVRFKNYERLLWSCLDVAEGSTSDLPGDPASWDEPSVPMSWADRPILDARARVGRIPADTHCAGGAGRATDAGASPLVRTIMREAR